MVAADGWIDKCTGNVGQLAGWVAGWLSGWMSLERQSELEELKDRDIHAQ